VNIIIAMAGRGSRFKEAGFNIPKYQIEVNGRTLFNWSMESLRSFIQAHWRFVFITRKEDDAHSFIQEACKNLGIAGFDIIVLDAMTDGQATTVLYAEQALRDPHAPIAIYNIDTYVDPASLPMAAIRGKGWVPCFPGDGDAWSFVRVDEYYRADEFREKQRISPHATVGLYWFESFTLYKEAYISYYKDPSHIERGERYVAPLYNQLILEGHEVFIHQIPPHHVHPLGTPADVLAFQHGHLCR